MKNEREINLAIEKYADTVRRICFIHLKNHADAEDVFQEVFLKYALRVQPFENETHEKAWFIRVAVNSCKDVLKGFFRGQVSSFEDLRSEPFYFQEGEPEVLSAVLGLPEKYRDIIYMHYYEGYSAVEIAGILGKKENTVYTWLDRGRKKLKERLGR